MMKFPVGMTYESSSPGEEREEGTGMGDITFR